MIVKFKKLDPRAVVPTKAHKQDAGFDLTCTRITTELNECGQLVLVYHTDIAVEIPEGYFGLFVPRSSIFKKSLRLANAAGVIDQNFRGGITGKFMSTTDVVPSVYKEGERFAQLLILPVPDVEFIESDILSTTDRGENGYGSTGDESQSAPITTDGRHDDKDESTNHQLSDVGSGEAQNSLEQVQ